MANHCCKDGSLECKDYSAPVPVIGFYIFAASLLCAAGMLYDTATGFRARKNWFPCKYFKLNSVTLTVLSIVTKLPVDLTTSMPSGWDQISKLTGTAVICISMGFLAPSIGVNGESECLSNMVALTIFVITVAVNICMQLYTGVIVLLFVEHIIILVMMLLLLLFLWRISFHIKSEKKHTTDQYNNLFKRGDDSMFERLKLCRLYAYCTNPQFTISKHTTNAAVSTICLACSGVVIEAACRSLKQLSFCKGHSDYGRSMPCIVVAQLLIIIVGNFTILYRWLSLLSHMDLDSIILSFLNDDDMRLRNKTLGKKLSLERLNVIVVSIAQLLIMLPSVLLHFIPCLYKREELERFEQLHHDGVIAASPYIVRKSVKNFIRLSELCNRESLVHLPQLLLQRRPSQNIIDVRLHPMEIRDQNRRIKVCSFSMAILVKIAQVSIPEGHNGFRLLLDAFKEAKEIILFIDNVYIQPKTSEDYDRFSYVEALWTGGDFNSLVPHDLANTVALDRPLQIMNSIKNILEFGIVWSELHEVVDFINRRDYLSVGDLYTSIEQLFVDMLHITLAQLPAAIFKSLSNSSAEEFEDRVQLAMKFLFKTGCLDNIIRWWFPGEYNIANFIISLSPRRPLIGALANLEGVVPRGLDNAPMHGAQGV